MKKSCGDKACEKVVIPCGDFAFETHAVFAGGFADQVVGHVLEGGEVGGRIIGFECLSRCFPTQFSTPDRLIPQPPERMRRRL